MKHRQKQNDAIIISIEREARSTKKTGTLPVQPAKWKRNYRQMIMIIPCLETAVLSQRPIFLTGEDEAGNQ